MDKVKVVKLIKTKLKIVGKGEKDDPIRTVLQYWNLKGELMFEYDPVLRHISSDVFGIV